MSEKCRIALVKHGKYNGGGTTTVCRFIHGIISRIEHYEIDLFSLESAHNGRTNVRITSPRTWLKGIGICEYTWNSIRVKNVGSRFSEFEFQRYMPRRPLTNLLNQYDLIQFVSGSPAAAYAAKNVDKPICIQAATTVGLERERLRPQLSFFGKLYLDLMLPIIGCIEKKAIERADHIFADTAYTGEAFLPYTDASKITIDVIGVDIEKFRPIAENQRDDSYILSVGRFGDPRKNVVMLFEAYALIRQGMPDMPKLILAGKTPPPAGAWARAKELNITEYIEFNENISFSELISLYQNAAFFTLSSDEEGLGIVLLEAMACATPVISTRCGGPDSVVSDEVGFLTPVRDQQAMADRMLWMLQNPGPRRRMGRASRKLVERRFSSPIVAQKYINVYDILLGV